MDKIVVPKYVAEWYRINGGSSLETNIVFAFKHIEEGYCGEFYSWLVNNPEPVSILLDMRENGYCIEGEQEWMIGNGKIFFLDWVEDGCSPVFLIDDQPFSKHGAYKNTERALAAFYAEKFGLEVVPYEGEV